MVDRRWTCGERAKITSSVSVVGYERVDATLTGFNLLKLFFANSNAKTKSPIRYNRNMYNFEALLRPPSESVRAAISVVEKAY